MKIILYLIICTLAALTVVADGQSISQGQSIKILSSGDGNPKIPVPDEYKLSYSKLHPMGERIESSVLGGKMIVMADCYDFDWNDEEGTATVIESSRFMYGKMTCLKFPFGSNQYGNRFVQHLYMDYDIPIEVDENSSKVTLHTGELLNPFPILSPTRYCVYAMPEKWLTTQTDDCDDIVGRLNHDGSIEFNEGFAFLIEKKILRDSVWETSSWQLSPIFRNLHILVPNGKHTYISKPIDNKPLPPGGGTGGGLYPRPVIPKPVKPKPVTPRLFEPKLTLSHLGDATASLDLVALSSVHDQELQIPLGDGSTQHTVPVYIYHANDTTIYVYNLFGTDYDWNHMIINRDRTISFPIQAVSYDGYYGLFNYSCLDKYLESGNQGIYYINFISWDDTYFDYEYVKNPIYPNIQFKSNGNSMLDSVYTNNRLYF